MYIMNCVRSLLFTAARPKHTRRQLYIDLSKQNYNNNIELNSIVPVSTIFKFFDNHNIIIIISFFFLSFLLLLF